MTRGINGAWSFTGYVALKMSASIQPMGGRQPSHIISVDIA